MNMESIKYGDICDKCAHCGYCDMAQFGGHEPPITACFNFKEKSQTNADRIRAMTDKELSSVFANLADCRYCSVKTARCAENETRCRAEWLDWLKQEVKDEHTD